MLDHSFTHKNTPALNGNSFSSEYQKNSPFPHIQIDHFFSDDLLNKVSAEFPAMDDPSWKKHVHKFSIKLALNDLSKMGPTTRNFLHFLNSPPFLKFLEEMTGIEGLVPDPYYEGGGLHQITRGGFLGVHADFNFHKQLKLHRRINLLIYLNEDWDESYGGALELWDEKMTAMQKRILPVFNRFVVFNTTDFSYHGHPEPLSCPESRTRKSLALYYYSADRPAHEISESHTTIYRARPSDPADLQKAQTKIPVVMTNKPRSFLGIKLPF